MAHRHLSKTYLKLSKLDSAIFHIRIAKEIVDENDYLEAKKAVYGVLVEISEKQGDFKPAHEYNKVLARVKDSIISIEKTRQFEFAKLAYESDKKERQIASLELERKAEKIKRITYATGLVLTLISASFIVYLLRCRIRKNKQLSKKQQQMANEKLRAVQKELDCYTLQLIERATRIEQLNTELDKVKEAVPAGTGYPGRDGVLHRLMQATILTNDEWVRYKKLFNKVHPGFFISLRQAYEDLTETEERLLALTKLNLQTKEIAAMLGISAESVNKSRYRLRKKLNINTQQLEQLLASF